MSPESTMMLTLSTLFNRAKVILQTEGLLTLVVRGFDFLVSHIFKYGTFYLYEHTIQERSEADFLPKIQNCTVRVVSTNEQADELAANANDFRSYFIGARQRLDKGAIAFCVFVEGELAHIGWVAMTEEAKNTFVSLPFRVDFSNKEACTGGTITIPKFRGKGLMAYGMLLRLQFLGENGITTSRNAVDKGNIASQRAHAKLGPRVYAKARYLKVLWWEFWKETPFADDPPPSI